MKNVHASQAIVTSRDPDIDESQCEGRVLRLRLRMTLDLEFDDRGAVASFLLRRLDDIGDMRVMFEVAAQSTT